MWQLNFTICPDRNVLPNKGKFLKTKLNNVIVYKMFLFQNLNVHIKGPTYVHIVHPQGGGFAHAGWGSIFSLGLFYISSDIKLILF